MNSVNFCFGKSSVFQILTQHLIHLICLKTMAANNFYCAGKSNNMLFKHLCSKKTYFKS